MNNRSNRRSFLAAGASAITWAGGRSFAAGAPLAGPNEIVNLGVIGCGGEGQALIRAYRRLAGVRIAAVCDVHAKKLAQARELAGNEKVLACSDFRKLLDARFVDAVLIATTDHWHALLAIHACQAGKDVYVEKPLATSIGEGRAMVRAARKYNRIVQIGTQQRSWPHYIEAVERIQSGALGEISEVKVWDYDYMYPGPGNPPDSDPPEALDWDFYLGPAPKVPYNINRYVHPWFHFFFDQGCGWQTDWGTHHYDVVHWALGVHAPIAATAIGGFFSFEKTNLQWPDTFDGILEYPPGPVCPRKGFFCSTRPAVGVVACGFRIASAFSAVKLHCCSIAADTRSPRRGSGGWGRRRSKRAWPTPTPATSTRRA